MMRSLGINGGEFRGQPANRGSPEKIELKGCVCVRACVRVTTKLCAAMITILTAQ